MIQIKYLVKILVKEHIMNAGVRTLEELFEQLGLSSQQIQMELFIEKHQLQSGAVLPDAIYWTSNQRAFLVEAKEDDSEWSEVVDQLAGLLIAKSP